MQSLSTQHLEAVHEPPTKYLLYHLLFKFLPAHRSLLQLTPLPESASIFLEYLHSCPSDLDHRIVLFKLQHNTHYQNTYPNGYSPLGGDKEETRAAFEQMVGREVIFFQTHFFKSQYEFYNQLRKNQLDIYVEEFLEQVKEQIR